jgi:hypothetical protein
MVLIIDRVEIAMMMAGRRLDRWRTRSVLLLEMLIGRFDHVVHLALRHHAVHVRA